MLKKMTLTVLAAATAMTAVPAAADARPRGYYNDSYYSQNYGDRYRRGDYYRGYSNRAYSNRGYYGRDRYYGRRCRDKGTTGTIVGAIAGGLLGKEIAEGGRYRRGDGTTGAIIGGAVGALAGRAIDRNC
jgi:hypothetical protein